MVERIIDDPRTAGLPERQLVMLDFAEKLTATPSRMVKADYEALRRVGLSDEDVLHLVEVIAYYAYANRIVDGLGVSLEPMPRPEPGVSGQG